MSRSYHARVKAKNSGLSREYWNVGKKLRSGCIYGSERCPSRFGRVNAKRKMLGRRYMRRVSSSIIMDEIKDLLSDVWWGYQ